MKTETIQSIVSSEPGVMSGTAVFAGTRVPVTALFENLKDGASIDDFVEWFPGVSREQIVSLLDLDLELDSFSTHR